jgi:hypothetical protein
MIAGGASRAEFRNSEQELLNPRREIIVVDRRRRSILEHIPLGSFADNYPMSLDGAFSLSGW